MKRKKVVIVFERGDHIDHVYNGFCDAINSFYKEDTDKEFRVTRSFCLTVSEYKKKKETESKVSFQKPKDGIETTEAGH